MLILQHIENLKAIHGELEDRLSPLRDSQHEDILNPLEEVSDDLQREIDSMGKVLLQMLHESDPLADKPGEYTFPFEETADPRKAKPYVARLKLVDGKLDRDFFGFDQTYGRKEVTVYGDYTLKVGDIVEIQEGGSWKNKYRDWHICLEGGDLKRLGDYQNSRLKMKIIKVLSGKEPIESLLKED